MEKMLLLSIDVNDIFLDMEKFIIENGCVSLSTLVNGDKYGFKPNYRFPIKRVYSSDLEISSTPYLPFLGSRELVESFILYFRSDLSKSCFSELYREFKELDNEVELVGAGYQYWFDPFQNYLSFEDNTSPYLLYIEDIIRNLKLRLNIPSMILADDILTFNISGVNLDLFSHGSVFKYYYRKLKEIDG